MIEFAYEAKSLEYVSAFIQMHKTNCLSQVQDCREEIEFSSSHISYSKICCSGDGKCSNCDCSSQ